MVKVERIFWDVDTQVDFMLPTGKLYIPGAEVIIPQLAALRSYARAEGVRTIASADDHRPDDAEISDHPDFRSTFPPHCLHGSPGQHRIPETALTDPLVFNPEPMDPAVVRHRVQEHGGDVLFLKQWFDVFTNANVEPVLDEIAPAAVTLFGVALDVCDRHAVEGLLRRRPDIELSVVTDAVRAIDEDEGRRLLDAWRERGVHLVTTDEVI